MKATISELDSEQPSVWEGEAISAEWDGQTGEFLIKGDAEDKALGAVLTSVSRNQRLAIGLEDRDNSQLVWRGTVGSARFVGLEAESVRFHLVLRLDDWFGIFPRFRGFYFA